jgi:hypothetical protein
MTGNGSGSGFSDPGIYAHPQSTGGTQQSHTTQSQTDAAYNNYGLHHYHGNVQNLDQVNQTVSQQDQSKYGPLVGPLLNLINGHGEVDDKLTSTAKNLKQGLDIRSAPASVGAHYEGIPHQELYNSVTQSVDPGSVGDVSDTWLGIGNKLTNLQTTVAQSIASSQTSWSGQAAEQARQSIATLGNKSGQAGQASQLAGVLTAQQSEALTTAKNSVPPPPKPPYSAAVAQQQLQTIQDPIAFAKQAASDQAKASAQQAAHKLAAHVVQQYDQTVSQTSASMPAFAPAPPVAHPGQHVPVSTPGPTGPGAGPRGGGPTAPGSVTPIGHVAATHTPGGRPSDTVVGPTIPGVDGNQQTTTAGFVPPGSTGGGPGVSGTGPFGTGGGPGGGGGSTGGGLPGEFGMGGFGAGGGSGFGAGGSGFGGSGAGGAGGRFGGGSGGSGGLGGSSGAAGGSDAAGAGRSGVGAGAAAAEEGAMGGGGAGAAGARGSSGMGGMGAGRGAKGQGDAEHKRPDWLLENDEGIFGTDELTAPPVIGE